MLCHSEQLTNMTCLHKRCFALPTDRRVWPWDLLVSIISIMHVRGCIWSSISAPPYMSVGRLITKTDYDDDATCAGGQGRSFTLLPVVHMRGFYRDECKQCSSPVWFRASVLLSSHLIVCSVAMVGYRVIRSIEEVNSTNTYLVYTGLSCVCP